MQHFPETYSSWREFLFSFYKQNPYTYPTQVVALTKGLTRCGHHQEDDGNKGETKNSYLRWISKNQTLT